jgi:hypothetical protein
MTVGVPQVGRGAERGRSRQSHQRGAGADAVAPRVGAVLMDRRRRARPVGLLFLVAVAVAVAGAGTPAGAEKGAAARRSAPCDGPRRRGGPPLHLEVRPGGPGPSPRPGFVRPGDHLKVALPGGARDADAGRAPDAVAWLCVGPPGERPVAVPIASLDGSRGRRISAGAGPPQLRVPRLAPGSRLCLRGYVLHRRHDPVITAAACVVVAPSPPGRRPASTGSRPHRASSPAPCEPTRPCGSAAGGGGGLAPGAGALPTGGVPHGAAGGAPGGPSVAANPPPATSGAPAAAGPPAAAPAARAPAAPAARTSAAPAARTSAAPVPPQVPQAKGPIARTGADVIVPMRLAVGLVLAGTALRHGTRRQGVRSGARRRRRTRSRHARFLTGA